MKPITPIPEKFRQEAASIYFDAFSQKIGWLLGDTQRAISFIANIMNLNFGYCVCEGKGDDQRLLGIAGFKTPDGGLIEGKFSDLVHEYGYLPALLKAIPLSLLDRSVEENILLMDGIAVSSLARGKGAGTLLLDAIIAHGRAKGFTRVRLDVVNTNPRARALYVRNGFVAVEDEHFPLMRLLFGFDHATRMEKRL